MSPIRRDDDPIGQFQSLPPDREATTDMLSAAASTIPRLRLATQPRTRLPSARSHWLRPLSSATHVTPASAAGAGAGAGALEPPDLARLASAARISLSPQEVSQPGAFSFVSV